MNYAIIDQCSCCALLRSLSNHSMKHLITKWAASWQNQQNGMCAQRRLRSAWASAQSDQSSLWRLIRLGGCPGWSESSLGTQSFCWFCDDAAQILKCPWYFQLSVHYRCKPGDSTRYRKKQQHRSVFEPHHDKTNRMACAPSEDSDQPGHPPSLIRIFAVRLKKARIRNYPLSAQRRLWSNWADAQADLSFRWAHMPFCWFCHDAAHFLVNALCHLPFTNSYCENRTCEMYKDTGCR